jgi:hypothetical protein
MPLKPLVCVSGSVRLGTDGGPDGGTDRGTDRGSVACRALKGGERG